jgi:hypothetical protein
MVSAQLLRASRVIVLPVSSAREVTFQVDSKRGIAQCGTPI